MVPYLSLEGFLLAGHHDRRHIRKSWCCSPVLPERRKVDLLQVLLPLRDGRQVGGLEHHCGCHGQSHARTPRLRAQGRQLLYGQGMHRCVNSGCNRVWCSSSSRAPAAAQMDARGSCVPVVETPETCAALHTVTADINKHGFRASFVKTQVQAHMAHVLVSPRRTWDCRHSWHACFLPCGNISCSHWTRLQLRAAADHKRAALPLLDLLLCCPTPAAVHLHAHKCTRCMEDLNLPQQLGGPQRTTNRRSEIRDYQVLVTCNMAGPCVLVITHNWETVMNAPLPLACASVPCPHNACPASGPGGWDTAPPRARSSTQKWVLLAVAGTHPHTPHTPAAATGSTLQETNHPRHHTPGNKPGTAAAPATTTAAPLPHRQHQLLQQQAGPCSSPSCYVLPPGPTLTLSHTHTAVRDDSQPIALQPPTTHRGRPGRRRPCRRRRRPGRRRPRTAWP